ncbi:MAG: hypothetical protein H6767_02185 [Candidatus Peribacteria bacterium]|nr:MAG: hypothetical protein H6767_02185 [Candidatus Peribacteria bacterium]
MGIILTETFQKKYKKLDITLQNNFKEKLQLFITHGIQHPSLRIHKLK